MSGSFDCFYICEGNTYGKKDTFSRANIIENHIFIDILDSKVFHFENLAVKNGNNAWIFEEPF